MVEAGAKVAEEGQSWRPAGLQLRDGGGGGTIDRRMARMAVDRFVPAQTSRTELRLSRTGQQFWAADRTGHNSQNGQQ